MNIPLAILDFLGPSEILFVAIVAILLFGERLPEVAQSIGKQFRDFRNSLQGIQNEFRAATTSVTNSVQGVMSPDSPSRAGGDESEVREEATAPKFVPPPAESHDASAEK